MNAKEEFLSKVSMEQVICAYICSMDDYGDEPPRQNAILKKGFTEEDWNAFLKQIDFNYNNGFGGQELDGCIWLTNNQWYDRGEYDGSEWWQFHSYPEIPVSLL